MTLSQRLAKLEKEVTEVDGPVVCYGYHAGDLVERDRNRQAAIWEWQAEHGKKLDEEKTQWIVWKIVTTKEDLERE